MWPLLLLGAGLLAAGTRKRSDPTKGMSAPEVARLNRLQPKVRAAVLMMRQRLLAQGRDFFLGDTLRDAATQARMVETGRSATRMGFHRSGRAADIYMKDARGQPDVRATDRAAYDALHAAARDSGLLAYGWRVIRAPDGRAFVDPYHVELREGLGAADALVRYARGLDRSADGAVYV